MIPLSISQKNVVLEIFKEDIKLVKKHFMGISFDFDERFKYDVFREFIFSAAGMFKELDLGIYNKQLITQFQTIQLLDERYLSFKKRTKYALKLYQNDFLSAQDAYKEELKRYDGLVAALQVLTTKEKNLYSLRQSLESNFKKLDDTVDKERREKLEKRLKTVRREHVDTLHMVGEHRHDIEEADALLIAFEEQHKKEFLSYFEELKEKLDYQYEQSLNYFGYEFNEALFASSEQSALIKKFKKEANIDGVLNLCKYVEYYIRNVNPEMIADTDHKERLREAKQYCKNHSEQENLF